MAGVPAGMPQVNETGQCGAQAPVQAMGKSLSSDASLAVPRLQSLHWLPGQLTAAAWCRRANRGLEGQPRPSPLCR